MSIEKYRKTNYYNETKNEIEKKRLKKYRYEANMKIIKRVAQAY